MTQYNFYLPAVSHKINFHFNHSLATVSPPAWLVQQCSSSFILWATKQGQIGALSQDDDAGEEDRVFFSLSPW